MSPPTGQDAASSAKAQHRRNASGSASPRPDSKATKTPPPSVHYTLLIRLPFARGDFEDPPQVEWDATKDRKLWKIISKNSKSADIDWANHAQDFGVSQPFLLQQAAWLYERHFKNVKAQMNKLRSSNAPVPLAGTASQQPALGGIAMKRLGSGGASRAPSSLSVRSRDSPLPRAEASIPGTPRTAAPVLSRTPSTNTVTQSRHFLPPASPRQPVHRSFRSSANAARKADANPLPATAEASAASPSPPASSSSSTSSSESDEGPIRRSQMFRRPPPFQQHKKTPLSNVDDAGEDSDADSPTFLPFATQGNVPPPREDPSATLRDITPPRTRATTGAKIVRPSETVTMPVKGKGKQTAVAAARLESSASSASSAAPPSSADAAQHRRIDALSPRHRAELARLSPRRQGTKDGSDGTPSMGSSFSDLDDTSITQSALEEALASNLRHGGASRLSTISHAFGSRLYGRGQQQGGYAQ